MLSPVEAENDCQRIELGVSAASLGGATSVDFIIETTDWAPRTDLAAYDQFTVKTLVGGLPLGITIDRTIIEPSANQYATAFSNQRKLLWDGTNFWSFYWTGSNTVYRYSTDGITWSSTTQAFTTSGVDKVSIWYDSANNAVYAVGDTSTSSVNIYIRKGTVTPSTHTITWDTQNTFRVTANTLGGKNAFVSQDASGYIWVLSSNCTRTTPTATYDLTAFKSQSTNSVTGTWSNIGSMLTTDDGGSSLKGVIVPAGTGSYMWSVYGYGGNVSARKYTTSWSSQTDFTNVDKTDVTTNTDLAPPSAIVDGRGVCRVVYGDSNTNGGQLKSHIYSRYNSSATAWSAPDALSTTNPGDGYQAPTLSLDASNNNAFAFWVQLGDNSIVFKKYSAGAWSGSTSTLSSTAYAKNYLTSVYSAPTEARICVEWTQNTTGTVQVIFEKIPEFGDVVVPVFSVLVVFIAVYRRRARADGPEDE